MRAQVLGALRLECADGEVAPPSGQVGSLLQYLLLRPNEFHSSGALIGLLWPDGDEKEARSRLHVTVSRLRRFLDEDGEDDGLAISTGDDSYRFEAGGESLDRVAFERSAAKALAGNDAHRARSALNLWGGEPYTGFAWTKDLQSQRAFLVDLRRRLLSVTAATVSSPNVESGLVGFRPPGVEPSPPSRAVLLQEAPAVGQVPIVAVTAPAGYGKSTFLAHWVDAQTAPVAWMSLSADLDDPERFWSHFLARVAEALDQEPPALPARPSGPVTQYPEVVRDALGAHGGEIGVVLDDFHRITSRGVIDEVASLTASLPDGATIAFGSRLPLPFPTARLQAGGGVHAITERRLGFTHRDVIELSDGQRHHAQAVWDTTEGWPVAVESLLSSGGSSPADAVASMGQYVVDEVLADLPPAATRFLAHAAHLSTFNSELSDIATGGTDSAELLAWLKRQGLFIIEIESDHATLWYRLQRVLSAVILDRRADWTIDHREIHVRAARWCLDQGMESAALRHGIRAGDQSIISATAAKVILGCALRGEAATCVRWLRLLDPETLTDEPRAHGIATCLAALWMNRIERTPWIRSRVLHYGDDGDLILKLVRGLEAMREGRSTEAVDLSEQVMNQAGEYGDDFAPDLVPLLVGCAFENLVRARVMQDTLDHDDPMFGAAVGAIRPVVPLMAAFLNTYWALLALMEGADELATSLAGELFEVRRSFEPIRQVRRDNSVIGALLASRRTNDPDTLCRLAAGLEDLVEGSDLGGSHTDTAIMRLVVAHLYRRGGDAERSRHHLGRAELLVRTFEDAPFIERFRRYLITREGPDSATGAAVLERLTPRQRTVLGYLATDLSNKQIAHELHISIHTVRAHLKAIYRHLGVRSRHQAILRIQSDGLDLLDPADSND